MAKSDLNSVVMVGRLVKDADLKYLQSGTAVATLTIAVNRNIKRGDQWIDEASFFDITYFGRGAEAVKQYLTKGKQIAIQGELKQDRWERDGQKHSRIGIVASSIQLLGGNTQSGQVHQAPQSGGQNQNRIAPNRQTDFGYQEDIPYETSAEYGDDIPF